MKNTIIFILTAILITFGYYYLTSIQPTHVNETDDVIETPSVDVPADTQVTPENPPAQTPTSSDEVTEDDVPMPYIESISPTAGKIGTVVTLKGRDLAGYSGDLDGWIENSDGKVGYLPAHGDTVYPHTDTITVQIPQSVCTINNTYSGRPCTNTLVIEPGQYKIFTRPWGNESNKVTFTVEIEAVEDVSQEEPSPITETVTKMVVPCSAENYPDKLESCEPYTCTYFEIFDNTGTSTREIVGLVDGVCVTKDTTPNTFTDCSYSEELRKEVAVYLSHRWTATQIEITDGIENIDGKEFVNPLNKALENGECVFTSNF